MVTPRRRCDLPPFRLVLFPACDSEPIFEALSTGFFGLCSCAFWFDCSLTVLMFSNTAFGDDAQGSVWYVGLLGIVGGSIRCCAHPSVVSSPWLLMVVSVALMLLAGLRAVQVLVQRSTCSRLLAYRSWFGGHRVSKPLAGQGAFEDCIEGLRAIFNDVTEIPGIRSNEVNLTF
ncbi:unnamed protein product, partial [Brassica oleracea]